MFRWSHVASAGFLTGEANRHACEQHLGLQRTPPTNSALESQESEGWCRARLATFGNPWRSWPLAQEVQQGKNEIRRLIEGPGATKSSWEPLEEPSG